MNRRSFCRPLMAVVSVLALTAWGNPVPQPQMQLSKGLQGTFNADWEGVPGRTYFTQFSLNLVDWHYAPFIDYGGGEHHRGIECDAGKLFLRLDYGDFPGIFSLEEAMNADFDGDGLSNIFEVMNAMNPMVGDPDNDADADGLMLLSEQQYGTSPKVRDHPAVKLSVMTSN